MTDLSKWLDELRYMPRINPEKIEDVYQLYLEFEKGVWREFDPNDTSIPYFEWLLVYQETEKRVSMAVWHFTNKTFIFGMGFGPSKPIPYDQLNITHWKAFPSRFWDPPQLEPWPKVVE